MKSPAFDCSCSPAMPQKLKFEVYSCFVCQASHREKLAVGNPQLHAFSHLVYPGWMGNSHTWVWPGTLARWWSSGRQEAWEGLLGHSSLRCQPSSLRPTEIVKLTLTRELPSKKLDSYLGILLAEHFVFKFLTFVSHSIAGRLVSLVTCYVCGTVKCHSMEESWETSNASGDYCLWTCQLGEI